MSINGTRNNDGMIDMFAGSCKVLEFLVCGKSDCVFHMRFFETRMWRWVLTTFMTHK